MNFLAHCLIGAKASTCKAPELIAGGFLGDFIKGPVPADLPADLALGVRLHRRVDAYSNQHPDIRASCNRFPAPLRRMAPIFVDIVADHCLARAWGTFSNEPIDEFAQRVHSHIAAHHRWLPERGARFFRYMSSANLLAGYRQVEVMHEGLRSVTRRLDHQHLDDDLTATVTNELTRLEADFFRYFPDLVTHARDWVTGEMTPSLPRLAKCAHG